MKFSRRQMLIASLFLPLIALKGFDLAYPLPMPDEDRAYARIVTDYRGTPLRAFADAEGIWRYPVQVGQVSPLYRQALLGYEDRWFRYHPGVNPLALVRALYQNLKEGRVISGGSTLTMQVARLLDPHTRTVKGKLQQISRALQLEWHLEKDQILDLYLNFAPFGGTLEGVQAASFTFFGKSASELTHAEAALLAVLPQAPSRLRPDRYPERARRARDKVLQRLADQRVWLPSVVADARMEPVIADVPRQPMLAPLLARYLVQNYPQKRHLQTTIDADLQSALQDHLSSWVEQMPAHSSAAVLVVNNATMQVRAYLGSAVFADAERFGHVDMVRAVRSPGSTLKPFLYGIALDRGLIHSYSLLKDVPRTYGDYRPSNFNNGFAGPVSVSQALQQSLNLPAIEVIDQVGPGRFAATLANAGLKLRLPEGAQPSLAIILGGVGTTLEGLVQSYTALANQGRVRPLAYLQGDNGAERYLMSPGAAWIVRRILQENRNPNRIQSNLIARDSDGFAWKTGTSYGFRDAWAIGVNDVYTVGVWVGRPDGTPMPGHYGAVTAIPLLYSVAGYLDPPFGGQNPQPKTVSQIAICWPLGIAEVDQDKAHCQQRHEAWVLNGTVPPTWPDEKNQTLANPYPYWVSANTGKLVDATCSVKLREQRSVALWPKSLGPWLPGSLARLSRLPVADDSCPHPPAQHTGAVTIVGIETGSIYRPAGAAKELPTVALSALGGRGQRYWFINGRHRYTTRLGQVIPHPFQSVGTKQITVLDDQGDADMVVVNVVAGPGYFRQQLSTPNRNVED